MRLYECIKYAAERDLNLCIKYDKDEELTRIIVSGTDGVSLYQKEMRMYSIESIDPRLGDLLIGNVKELVDEFYM